MVQHRSQSALEFLSTYAFVFLMLAIVISLLFVFASLPRSLLPSQCTFYSGFTCMQAIYTINTTAGHGAELFVVAEDTQPGTVNVSSFSAYLNFHTSNAGSCEPSVATAGQKIYCIANFTATPTLASTYDGTFRMNADYCASGLNTISNESCRANSNFSYTGHITVQASKFNIGRTMLVPLTLTNSQNAAVPAHFDQMVNFSASKYLPYVNSNLGNIRFYYGSKELYSWCESSCNTSSTSNSIFWIRLPQAIPANSVMPIEMYILPQSVGYTGKHAGEAPQWTCPNPSNTASCGTYGKYDNGPSVFLNYWNFAGTSLPSNLAVNESGASYSINNGLTVSGSGGSIFVYYNAQLAPASYIIDEYFDTGTANSDAHNELIGWGTSFSGGSGGVWWGWTDGVFAGTNNGGPAYFMVGSVNGAALGEVNSAQSITYPFITSIHWTSSSSVTGWYNYGVQTNNTVDVPAIGNAYPIVGYISSGGSVTYYWARIRTYPPNGVMPSVSFGAIGPA